MLFGVEGTLMALYRCNPFAKIGELTLDGLIKVSVEVVLAAKSAKKLLKLIVIGCAGLIRLWIRVHMRVSVKAVTERD